MSSPPGPIVLHVATRFLGGGSEQRIIDCIEALPGATHQLLVGEMDGRGAARCPLWADAVEIEPALRRAVRPLADGRALRRLSARLRDRPPAVVVTHQSKAGVLGRLAARRRRIPVVHSLSMTSFGDGYSRAGSSVYRSIERSLAPITAGYAVVGADLADRYRAIGVPGEKLQVVRSRVRLPAAPTEDAPAARTSLRRAVGMPEKGPLVAYVGSLEPRKGVLELPGLLAGLRALPAAADAGLVVAGDGPLREDLRRALEGLGLTGCSRLLGHVADVEDVFGAVDLVVLPSTAEGLPQVLVQASAIGTPWVAYDVCGVAELIHGGAVGTAVKPGDTAAFVAAAAASLAGPRSPGAFDGSSWAPAAISAGWAGLVGPLLPSAAAG